MSRSSNIKPVVIKRGQNTFPGNYRSASPVPTDCSTKLTAQYWAHKGAANSSTMA